VKLKKIPQTRIIVRFWQTQSLKNKSPQKFHRKLKLSFASHVLCGFPMANVFLDMYQFQLMNSSCKENCDEGV
jgi:hypothetical protein